MNVRNECQKVDLFPWNQIPTVFLFEANIFLSVNTWNFVDHIKKQVSRAARLKK